MSSADLTAHLTRAAIRVDEVSEAKAVAYAREFTAILENGVQEDELSAEQWEALGYYLGAEPPIESIDELSSVPLYDRDFVWRAQMAGLISVATGLALVRSGAIDSLAELGEDIEAQTQRIASGLSVDELKEARVDRRSVKEARRSRRGN